MLKLRNVFLQRANSVTVGVGGSLQVEGVPVKCIVKTLEKPKLEFQSTIESDRVF